MKIAYLQQYVESLTADEREALDDEGLRVHKFLRSGGYNSSPQGYVAFASTGGDGVHFSVPPDAIGPVVMTVPMAFDSPNLVVGANLNEFLSLGCVYGYSSLEQLAYNMPRAIQAIEAAARQSPALKKLSDYFGLRSWPAIQQRLGELQQLAQQGIQLDGPASGGSAS